MTLRRGNGENRSLGALTGIVMKEPLHYLGQALSPGKGKAAISRQKGEVLSGTGECDVAAEGSTKEASCQGGGMSNSLQVTQPRCDQQNCTEVWVPLF